MDWISIIVAIIGALGGGGLVSLLTIRETKKGLKVENKDKESDVYIKLINELQDQIEKQNERLDKKDTLIQEKDDTIADLRSKLDSASTTLAKATLLKCSKLNCVDRIPPLGYAELSPEELIAQRVEKIEN